MPEFHLQSLYKIIHPENDKRTAVDRLVQNLASANPVLCRGGSTEPDNSVRGSLGPGLDSFQIAQSVSELLSPSCGMTDAEKNAYMQHILSKLKHGKKLTAEEMRFLQAENPALYMQAARVQSMRESFEQSLEQCASRAEAREAFSNAMSLVSDKDPMFEAITAAYKDAYDTFQKSDKYSSLPEDKKKS